MSLTAFAVRPSRAFSWSGSAGSLWNVRPMCCMHSPGSREHRIVFLGTPPVAARALIKLFNTAKKVPVEQGQGYEVIAVVTQPPAPVGRKRILTPSPVHTVAQDLGIPEIFTPISARDSEFLTNLASLKPDLCVTAAYGNFLPKQFLDIPRLGTLNIHPSLLPQFRGAAPVPRALEAGVKETGVSVAFTELKMDSGPILVQRKVTLDGSEQAPELLDSLFVMGTDALISSLPSVFSGTAAKQATPQNDDDASHAPKLTKEEGRLTFTENARIVHNKVRAFAGWPGTWAEFEIGDNSSEKEVAIIKVLQTFVKRPESAMCLGVHEIRLTDDGQALSVTCDDGSIIAITYVQPSGKSAMSARSFWNGLRGKTLRRKHLPH